MTVWVQGGTAAFVSAGQNATIDDGKVLQNGSSAGDADREFAFKFMLTGCPASGCNLMMGWTGHIASDADWGTGKGAASISGAPFHMRILGVDQVDGTSGGNQDRSVQLAALVQTLEVKKALVPTTDPGLFNLQIDGVTAGTGTNVGNGGTTGQIVVTAATHAVGETQGTNTTLSNYTTAISCVDALGNPVASGSGTSLSVTVTAGANVVCTITNTRNASLQIEKSTAGGTASFDYTVSGSGLAAFSRNTATQGNPTVTTPFTFNGSQFGDKYVTETALAGWTLTNVVCTANGATFAIGTGQGAGFSQGATAGFDPGDNTVKVTVAAGNTPSCTFTNTHNASLGIEKATTGGTATFSYTVSGSGLAAFSRNTATQGNPTVTTAFPFDGTQLGDKYVTETALAGWTLTNIVCTANGATTLIGTGQGGSFSQGATAGFDPGDNTVKVTVAAGNTPTCTFTNTQSASLGIEKATTGGTATFSYNGTGSGVPATFTRNTGTTNPTTDAAFAFDGTQLGDKFAEETPLPGWTLTNIVCTANGATFAIGTGQGGSFSQGATAGFDPGDNTVKVT
ncbi:MAG TPA: hypothetical protein VFI79_06325, partial [Gemmatimonadales bacterium]|nr:hypothetical protein [Gemmatimonadales bacterium]